jgi:hypothetical protein
VRLLLEGLEVQVAALAAVMVLPINLVD